MYEAVDSSNPLTETLLSLGYVQDTSEDSTNFGTELAFNKDAGDGYTVALNIADDGSFVAVYAPTTTMGGYMNKTPHTTKKRIVNTKVNINQGNAAEITNNALQAIEAHKASAKA